MQRGLWWNPAPICEIRLEILGGEGTYLDIIKAIYNKLKTKIIVNGEKWKELPLKSGTRQGVIFTTPIQYSSWNSNMQKKKTKGIAIGKEVKWSVCWWDDPICKKPQISTRRLLELIIELSEVAGYKINIHKSIAFLFSTSHCADKVNGKPSLPQELQQTDKQNILGVHLMKEVNDFYNKIYRTHKEGIEENLGFETPLMSWNRQNWYCPTGHTFKSIRQTQCNSHQDINDIFHIMRKIVQNIQRNREHERHYRGQHDTHSQILAQSSSKKHSLVLASE